MKVFLITLFLLTLFAASNAIWVYADSTDSAEVKYTYETINPDSIFYPLKRLWEKVEEKLPWVNHQRFLEDQLNVRFKEIYFVAKEKKLSQFETVTSRFITQIGRLNKQSNINQDVKDRAKQYQIVLKGLEQNYDEFAYTSLLKQAEESLQRLVDK